MCLGPLPHFGEEIPIVLSHRGLGYTAVSENVTMKVSFLPASLVYALQCLFEYYSVNPKHKSGAFFQSTHHQEISSSSQKPGQKPNGLTDTAESWQPESPRHPAPLWWQSMMLLVTFQSSSLFHRKWWCGRGCRREKQSRGPRAVFPACLTQLSVVEMAHGVKSYVCFSSAAPSPPPRGMEVFL